MHLSQDSVMDKKKKVSLLLGTLPANVYWAFAPLCPSFFVYRLWEFFQQLCEIGAGVSSITKRKLRFREAKSLAQGCPARGGSEAL